MLKLVNLSPFQARDVLIKAGAFGEHQFLAARYSLRTSDYPGEIGTYAAPELVTEIRYVPVEDQVLHVHMPAATEITLELETARFVRQGSYALPW